MRHCLVTNKISIPKKVIPLLISYILNLWLKNSNTDFILNNCLFGSVKLTKNADLDKYKYKGYGIVFDFRAKFSFTDERLGKKAAIFGIDMSLSVHIDNKNKDIAILVGGPQELHDSTLAAKTKYPINFPQWGKRFILTLHYNGSNSFLFLNATKIFHFKNISFQRLWNKRLCTEIR